MWHVSSRSGVATLRTAIHLLLTCYLPAVPFIITTIITTSISLLALPAQYAEQSL